MEPLFLYLIYLIKTGWYPYMSIGALLDAIVEANGITLGRGETYGGIVHIGLFKTPDHKGIGSREPPRLFSHCKNLVYWKKYSFSTLGFIR